MAGAERVGVWALSVPETAVAVIGALLAGVAAVPINPKAGERELGHIVEDSAPETILCAPGVELPAALAAAAAHRRRPRRARRRPRGPSPTRRRPALVVYTSGTTGPPKGAVLPRRAIASNLDALADAWEWTADDVVAHGLPLFHVHGLVIGIARADPPRRARRITSGASPRRASPPRCAQGATMVFGVPTMYHRLVADAEARRRDRGRAAAGRGCSCRGRPRCRRSTTSASSASAASASSSATG